MSQQTNDFQQLIALVVSVLEDGAIVEESKLFPDPVTNVPREVDVYALVEGKLNGQQVRIAVECVDRSKKMDAPWVEKMHGKHSRLQVADIVLLVSSKGFFKPAEKVAKSLGYHTIHPAISARTLTKKLGLADDLKVGFKMAMVDFGPITLKLAAPAVWDDDEHFRRADGSELVKQEDYRSSALFDSFKDADGTVTTWWGSKASESERTVTVTDPLHAGEPLHVMVRAEDGQRFVVRVTGLTFTAKVSASDQANIAQTEHGNFGGVPFGTGKTTFEGKPARMVVAEDTSGNWKAKTTWQYEVKPPAAEAV